MIVQLNQQLSQAAHEGRTIRIVTKAGAIAGHVESYNDQSVTLKAVHTGFTSKDRFFTFFFATIEYIAWGDYQ